MLVELLDDFVDGYVEEFHFVEEVAEGGVEKFLTARLVDVVERVGGQIEAHAAFWNDDAFILEIFVGFEDGVAVDRQEYGELADGGYALSGRPGSCQYLPEAVVDYLTVYRFIWSEIHLEGVVLCLDLAFCNLAVTEPSHHDGIDGQQSVDKTKDGIHVIDEVYCLIGGDIRFVGQFIDGDDEACEG